jgi:hypothetical protein
MTVWLVETRTKYYKSFYVTASDERAEIALSTAEERNVEVIVTPYEVEDFNEDSMRRQGLRFLTLN